MAVTAAAATAVLMTLLRSPLGSCTSRPVVDVCATGVKRLTSSMASRASTCTRLLPSAGKGPVTAVAAAAAEPGSRRRKGKASDARHPVQEVPSQQQQLQQTPQGGQAVPGQPQGIAAPQQQVGQVQEQQQQQQHHSRQSLWATAAQLGLKRGSEVAPPAATAGAQCEVAASDGSADDDLTGSSSSNNSTTSSSSRRRRSRDGSSSSEDSSSSDSSSRLHTNQTVGSSASSIEADNIAAEGRAGADRDGASDSISFSSRDDAVVSAIGRLGRFLDFRERCAAEVLTKLAALGYDGKLARRVLQQLQTAGLQSDARFAEMFVRGSWRTKAQSPAQLAYELRRRGVAQQHIDAAMSAVFGAGRQLPSREAANDQEEETWEHLVEVCRRRAELTGREPQQKRRAKLAAWLQRRGHTMSTVFRIFEAVGL